MPTLGADMDAGTVAEWRVAPGDRVARGDVVAVVSTDKSDIEVEVFEDGVVAELLVPVGREVAVGTPLARLEAAAPDTAAPRVAPAEAGGPRPTPAGAAGAGDPRVHSPVVRHLAEAHGLDLRDVVGTGPGGSVTRADVEAAVAAAQAEPAAASSAGSGVVPASPRARALARERGIELGTVPGTGPGGAVVAADLDDQPGGPARPAVATSDATGTERRAQRRRAVGDLMARSAREIPHYYLSHDVDLHAATAWLAEVNAARPPTERLLPAALLLRAVAAACRTNPTLNGHWVDGAHRPSGRVDLGVAISLRGGGLVAPTIADAGDLGVEELMARLRGLVERARAGRLRSSDAVEPTITVTNLGDQGTDAVFGVITPPQVALVGFGRITERPWAVDGMLAVHPVVTATLAADHRASDGRDGARFLTTVARLLQRPDPR